MIDNGARDMYILHVQTEGRGTVITVNVTALRNRLPEYLGRVRAGEEVAITSRGRVVARMVPDTDSATRARQMLKSLRGSCTIGDVISPTGAQWNAER